MSGSQKEFHLNETAQFFKNGYAGLGIFAVSPYLLRYDAKVSVCKELILAKLKWKKECQKAPFSQTASGICSELNSSQHYCFTQAMVDNTIRSLRQEGYIAPSISEDRSTENSWTQFSLADGKELELPDVNNLATKIMAACPVPLLVPATLVTAAIALVLAVAWTALAIPTCILAPIFDRIEEYFTDSDHQSASISY